MLSYLKSSLLYQKLRAYKHKFKRGKKSINKLNLDETKKILVDDLKVKRGDSLLIHCGFGYLNADYTPEELITMIQGIVGTTGNIVMPFYPPGLSRDWLESKRTFEAETIRCSTGVLAQIFSKTDGVKISTHPIKSVAVWGHSTNKIIEGHEFCMYPYDKTSPYYKFSKLTNAKVIGLGVRNCSLVHMLEDIYEEDKSYLYSYEAIKAEVKIKGNRSILVPTFYHHGEQKLCDPYVFIDNYFQDILNSLTIKNCVFYSINTDKFLDKGEKLFNKGINRKCL